MGGVTVSCWHRSSFGRNMFLVRSRILSLFTFHYSRLTRVVLRCTIIPSQGRINIPFHTIPYNKNISRWFPLHPAKGRSGNVQGEIKLNLRLKVPHLDLSSNNPSDLLIRYDRPTPTGRHPKMNRRRKSWSYFVSRKKSAKDAAFNARVNVQLEKSISSTSSLKKKEKKDWFQLERDFILSGVSGHTHARTHAHPSKNTDICTTRRMEHGRAT